MDSKESGIVKRRVLSKGDTIVWGDTDMNKVHEAMKTVPIPFQEQMQIIHDVPKQGTN